MLGLGGVPKGRSMRPITLQQRNGMAQSHARQSPSNNLNKRPSLQRPPAQHAAARTGENALPFGPMNSETVLRLQPVIGNQGVQHILARSHGAASADSAGTRFIQRDGTRSSRLAASRSSAPRSGSRKN